MERTDLAVEGSHCDDTTPDITYILSYHTLVPPSHTTPTHTTQCNTFSNSISYHPLSYHPLKPSHLMPLLLKERQDESLRNQEDFTTVYENVALDLAMSEGLGQKYGAPRRRAGEKIRTAVTRDEQVTPLPAVRIY